MLMQPGVSRMNTIITITTNITTTKTATMRRTVMVAMKAIVHTGDAIGIISTAITGVGEGNSISIPKQAG